MTFIDTTLLPEATYTNVNGRQIYDAVANAMTVNPAWEFVEYVDTINGANTYRRYVWKCLASQSGLSADFFVVFQVPFITATAVWLQNVALRVWMGETYSGGVLGKFITNQTASVTLASDLTNPATFTLSTYAVPASLWDSSNTFGTATNLTSMRYMALVAKDAFHTTWAGNGSGVPVQTNHLYVGAYDSVMSSVVDPMPIVVIGSGIAVAPNPAGACTRAPTFTAGAVDTELFAVLSSGSGGSGTVLGASNAAWEYGNSLTGSGQIGAASNFFKNMGGPIVPRPIVFPGQAAASWPTKGVFRGYLRHLYGASLATHAYGDTFVINGRPYAGTGVGTGLLISVDDA